MKKPAETCGKMHLANLAENTKCGHVFRKSHFELTVTGQSSDYLPSSTRPTLSRRNTLHQDNVLKFAACKPPFLSAVRIVQSRKSRTSANSLHCRQPHAQPTVSEIKAEGIIAQKSQGIRRTHYPDTLSVSQSPPHRGNASVQNP